MGSFDVACGVSRLPLHVGTPAVMIPLVKNKYGSEDLFGLQFVSNDGPMGKFYPLAAPIKGYYADYGNIEGVEDSAYWDLMPCTPERFMTEAYGDDGFHPAVEGWPKRVYGMWVHRGIYDHLIETSALAVDRARLGDRELLALGLEYVGKNEGRYKSRYMHPKYDGIVVDTDGKWAHVWDNKAQQQRHLYHPCELADLFIDHGLRLDWSALDVSFYIWNYERVTKAYLAKVAHCRSLGVEVLLGHDQQDYVRSLGVAPSLATHNAMRLVPEDKLMDVAPEMAELAAFVNRLWKVNCLLEPSFCGPQFGDDLAVLSLSGKTAEIAKCAVDEQEQEDW